MSIMDLLPICVKWSGLYYPVIYVQNFITCDPHDVTYFWFICDITRLDSYIPTLEQFKLDNELSGVHFFSVVVLWNSVNKLDT